MTRKVLINGVRLQVSKNEAKEAERLASFAKWQAQPIFATWYTSAPTEEARARRGAIGLALGLTL